MAMTSDEKAGQVQMAADARTMQAMHGVQEEAEIDLLEYWYVLWQKRWLIIGVSLLVAVLAAGYALSKPNIYRAEALLAPVGEGGKGGGLSSMLGGLGGLASLAGVSVGGGGSVEQNLAVLKSRKFIWGFVQDEKLMSTLFADAWDKEKQGWKSEEKEGQPSLWDAWRLMTGILTVAVDQKTALVTLSIEWEDPELATLWVSKLVARINQHLREQTVALSQRKLKYLELELTKTHVEENRRALFELIANAQKQAMLANTQQDFAFRIIDPASVPDKKSKPKRAIIVILAVFMAVFLCVIFIFIQEGIRKRKEEDTRNNA